MKTQERQENRKLLNRSDIFIIVGIVAACAAMLLWLNRPASEKVRAEISVDGKIVRTIDLDTAEDGVISLDENSKVHFQIENHAIRFVNTECPDKLCENVGYINRPNSVAICLPNRVSVRIVGKGEENLDIIVD